MRSHRKQLKHSTGLATKILNPMLQTTSTKTSHEGLDGETTDMIATALGFKSTRGKNLSAAAEKKIEIANRTWGKAKETVLDAYKQLLKDGWTPMEAGDICRERLTIFAPSTLREILPDESKHQSMKRLPSPSKEKERVEEQRSDLDDDDFQLASTQLDQECSQEQIAPKVAQFPPGLSSEVKQTLLSNPKLKQHLESLPANPNQPMGGHINKQQQQIEQEEPHEIYQIQPEHYLIQDLPKYDFEKRGEIIVYLHYENERLRTIIADAKLLLVASYDEACEYAHSQGITSRSQWRSHTKSEKFPNYIPKRPDSVYVDKGWCGWAAFFGKNVGAE